MLKRFKTLLGNTKDCPPENMLGNMCEIPSANERVSSVLVARQPIFSRDSSIWGFELLFRGDELANSANFVDSNIATSSVISDGFSLIQPGLAEHHKVLINFTAELLQEQIPRVLPAKFCGVEILETVQPSRELFRALLQLKHEGYLLAVDDYEGQPNLELFLKVADIVKVEVLGRSDSDIARDVERLREFPCTLLAEKIEDMRMFEMCRDLGFELFQGFFFSRPEIVKGKKLSASQIVKMRLLSQLSDDSFSVQEVGEVIRADVSLVYKLLRYLNSVHFALPTKVKSVEHGVALLGRRKLIQWLCVTVLSELESTPMSRHVVSHSAQRGKFLELLGDNAADGVEKESLFLLGLFSLLEALLSIPIDELLSGMPLDEALRDALEGEQTVYSQWLRFLNCYERGEWEQAETEMLGLGLKREKVAAAYEESIEWAASFFG